MNHWDICPSTHWQNQPTQSHHMDVKAQTEWTTVWCSTIPSGIERMKVVRHSCLINGFQMFSPYKERNSDGVSSFILNMTCYKWGIHELFIEVRSLQVGWEFMKHPAYERLYLWRNWGVLFLILHSPVTACIPSTKMIITSLSEVKQICRLLVVKIDLIIFPTI
jgi:hypothetical protein